jgi:RimJ/RimL family protein N-acetyltransferase
MSVLECVGALIRDDRHRVYVHRRTLTRRLLPGIWDIVGGHLESGETPLDALGRELAEETGWRLRRVEALIADWSWTLDGVTRHELDYLVEVDGDLTRPRLEAGKQDAFAWVGPDNLELLMAGRTDGDRRVRDIVARAVRTRLTPRLRLEPTGPSHVDDLLLIQTSEAVARWHQGAWDRARAEQRAAQMAAGWERRGVDKWVAYDRATGELIGRGGAAHVELGGRERVELGWTVRPEQWGRGYATEIGRAALRYAFDELGVASVVAFTRPDNRASRAVMERLRMRHVGEIEYDGEFYVLYELEADQPVSPN